MESALPSTDTPSQSEPTPRDVDPRETSTPTDRPWLHLLLFVLAFVSTTYVGITWANRMLLYEGSPMLFGTVRVAALLDGLRYAIPLLGFLTVHEFGHYFTARHHRINTSLPYYIPFPFNGIGNFGAVISIREPIPSTRTLFDVGVSGPLAGFVVAFGVLLYAFATLPPPEYLLDLPGHELIKQHIVQHGTFPETPPTPDPNAAVIVVGQTPLYWLLSQFFPNVPPMYEMYHYPVLFAGWLGLFFTALNLLPVGQLDGGHVLYALFGETWHRRLARGFVVLLLLSGGIGFVENVQPMLASASGWGGVAIWPLLGAIYYGYLYRMLHGEHRTIAPSLVGLLVVVAGAQWIGEPFTEFGYTGWLIWTLLIVAIVRVEHPPVLHDEPLTPTRRILGYLAILIFVLCFSLKPLTML